MKKRNLCFTILTSLTCLSVFAVTLGVSNQLTVGTRATDTEKVLLLDSTHFCPGTTTDGVAVMSDPNGATITYSNAEPSMDGLIDLHDGGFIQKDLSNDLKTIKASFTGGTLKAYTGYAQNDLLYAYDLVNGAATNVRGNFFKIVATGDVTVLAVEVKYNCVTRVAHTTADWTTEETVAKTATTSGFTFKSLEECDLYDISIDAKNNYISSSGTVNNNNANTIKMAANGNYVEYVIDTSTVLDYDLEGTVYLYGYMDNWKTGANNEQRSFTSRKSGEGFNFEITVNDGPVTISNVDSFEKSGLITAADASITGSGNSALGLVKVGASGLIRGGLNTIRFTRTESYNMCIASIDFIGKVSASAHAHNYIRVADADQATEGGTLADCTNDGKDAYKCSCGAKIFKTTTALGHAWVAGTTVQNTDSPAKNCYNYSCSRCTAKKVEMAFADVTSGGANIDGSGKLAKGGKEIVWNIVAPQAGTATLTMFVKLGGSDSNWGSNYSVKVGSDDQTVLINGKKLSATGVTSAGGNVNVATVTVAAGENAITFKTSTSQDYRPVFGGNIALIFNA